MDKRLRNAHGLALYYSGTVLAVKSAFVSHCFICVIRVVLRATGARFRDIKVPDIVFDAHYILKQAVD